MPKDGEVKSTSKGVGKLTDKQKRFIEEYLVDLNATQAAIRAGYSSKTAGQIGEQNLKKLEIQQAISEAKNKRSARTELTQDEIIESLREVRDISMGRKPIRVTEILKNAQNGTATPVDVEINVFEPHAANKAIELLGKHLGMFKDKVELSGNVTTANIQLSKEEFADIAKNLLSDV